MLNAKSGIADLLQPVGGAGSTRRQDAGGQDSSGLFGDALKGQMNQAAEGRKPVVREAVKPSGTEKRADSATQERAAAKTARSDKAPTDSVKTTPATAAETSADEAAPSENAAPVILLFPQDTVMESPSVLADDVALPAETAESGNFLPPAVPVIAADTAEVVATEVVEEADTAELPRWMHALAAAGRGREQAVVSRAAQQEPGAVTEGDSQSPAFLKGLQAVTAQLDGQRSDGGSRQGQSQGQGAEALFKLAGLTVSKEMPAPPMNMAASTVSTVAAAGPTAAPAAPPVQTLALDVPLRQAGWDQAMAERVVWMAKQGLQEAQIHLNPRNMGPIEVHVSVQKDQASVAFVAHHAVTREALEAAMPRLRDMLQDGGLNLAQSEVSQHDRQREQAAGFGNGHERGQQGQGGAAGNDEVVVAETPLRGGAGLGEVDYYA